MRHFPCLTRTGMKRLRRTSAFLDACQVAYAVLVRVIKSCVATVRGQDIVEKAIDLSENNIMVLPCFVGGWIEVVLDSTNARRSRFCIVFLKTRRGGGMCKRFRRKITCMLSGSLCQSGGVVWTVKSYGS